MPKPTIIFSEETGVIKVELIGSLDNKYGVQFKEEINKPLLEKSPQAVYLDLNKTSYIDSIGLGMIVYLHISLKMKGIPLKVRFNRSYKRVVNLTGLHRLLDVEPWEE